MHCVFLVVDQYLCCIVYLCFFGLLINVFLIIDQETFLLFGSHLQQSPHKTLFYFLVLFILIKFQVLTIILLEATCNLSWVRNLVLILLISISNLMDNLILYLC